MADITPFQGEQGTPIPQFTQLPTLNNQLPTVDPGSFNIPHTPLSGTNPYATTTNPDLQAYSKAYQDYLGRYAQPGEIEKYWSGHNGQTLQQKLAGIQSSPEASLYRRASSEVNPAIDSQEQDLARQAAIQRTSTENQISLLDPKYQQLFSSLQLGKNENEQAIAQQLASLGQNYDVTSNRLSQQLGQVPLQAFQFANRRGLLDSSITFDKLKELAQPVQNNLSDLTRTYAQNTSAAQQKLQTIIEKYSNDRQGLVTQREGEAGALRNAFATALAQLQSQASNVEAQRGQQTYARMGELGDNRFNQNLQQSQLDAYIKDLVAKQALAQQQQNEGVRQFNKLHP